MKRIENASKDVQNIFEDIWQKFLKEDEGNRFPYQVCGDFFLAGRESLVKELMDVETIAASKPKRTVARVYASNDGVFVISNDEKMFLLSVTGKELEWLPYPDLPQED